MKKLSFGLAVAALLSACGGGSGPTSSPVSSTPTPAVTAPAPVVAMPAVPAGAIKLSTGGLTQGANAGKFNITFNTAVNMTVSGQQNQLWAAAMVPGGTATVTGNQNTIVFLPGTDTIVNVSGSGNIFYAVQGSPIKFEGTGAAASTITYYTNSSAAGEANALL